MIIERPPTSALQIRNRRSIFRYIKESIVCTKQYTCTEDLPLGYSNVLLPSLLNEDVLKVFLYTPQRPESKSRTRLAPDAATTASSSALREVFQYSRILLRAHSTVIFISSLSQSLSLCLQAQQQLHESDLKSFIHQNRYPAKNR